VAQNSFKSFVRTRDYCTNSKQIISMCLNVIRVAIELGNYVHVGNYVQKAEQVPEGQVSKGGGKERAMNPWLQV
jgi:26S proteasome subunit RPN7